MLALYKLHLAEKTNDRGNLQITLRPETSLSDLERALSGQFVSVQDITLVFGLDLTLLNNIFWFHWRKKQRHWAMESVRENDRNK